MYIWYFYLINIATLNTCHFFSYHIYYDIQTNKYTHAHTESYTAHKWEEYKFVPDNSGEKNDFN